MTGDDEERREDHAQAVSSEIIKAGVAGAISAAPTASVPMIVAGAAFGALGGGVSEMLVRTMRSLRGRPDAALHEAHAELAARAVEGVRDQLEAKARALEEKVGPDDAAAAVPPVTNAWSSAWSRAEGRKQRILMAALVSSFDPESYEAGMALRCIGLLDRMDYPQVHQLMSDVAAAEAGCAKANRENPQQDANRDEFGFGQFAGDARAIAMREELGRLELLRLDVSERAVFGRGRWTITWLGFELADFLRRGGYNEPTPDRAGDAGEADGSG